MTKREVVETSEANIGNLMPISVAARRLGINPKTLLRMCQRREIGFKMVGSRRKLSEADLESYLKGRTF